MGGTGTGPSCLLACRDDGTVSRVSRLVLSSLFRRACASMIEDAARHGIWGRGRFDGLMGDETTHAPQFDTRGGMGMDERDERD